MRTAAPPRAPRYGRAPPVGGAEADPLASSAVLPEIELGPVTLQTFGLCFALACIAGGALV